MCRKRRRIHVSEEEEDTCVRRGGGYMCQKRIVTRSGASLECGVQRSLFINVDCTGMCDKNEVRRGAREREREREVYREERLGLMMCVCRVFIFKVTGPTPLRDGVRHKADVPTHLSPR